VSVGCGVCRHRLRAGRQPCGVTYCVRMTIVTVGHRYHSDHEVTEGNDIVVLGHTMKAYGGVDLQLHLFLIAAHGG